MLQFYGIRGWNIRTNFHNRNLLCTIVIGEVSTLYLRNMQCVARSNVRYQDWIIVLVTPAVLQTLVMAMLQ